MDFIRLRNLLYLQIPRLKESVTHPLLPGLCNKLGLPPPPREQPGMGKRDRLEASFKVLTDSELSRVAERLLAFHPPAPDIRNNIENILWSNQSVDIPRRIRRELARGLDISDLYRDAGQFEALLDRFWVLDDDPMEAFLLPGRPPKLPHLWPLENPPPLM